VEEAWTHEDWNQIKFEIIPADEHPVLTGLNTAYAEEEVHVRDFDPEDNWHKYEITWTPDYISFSIDDEEIRHEEKCNEVLADMNKE
jgi:beta-glucanase (GH16 family)